MIKDIKICSRCILDTTVNDIWFDDNRECKYCKIHDEMEKTHPLGPGLDKKLQVLVKKIKKHGKNKKYDCMVGVSGGRDSSYTLLTTKKLGLRPLAVTFDNGWGTKIAIKNIKKVVEKLNVDLHTVVADWEEMKDIQIAFLKASVCDADAPSDIAIYTVLYETAAKEGIKYIFNGHSFRTEGTSPISWTYMDSKYVRSVHKRYGKIKRLKTFPLISMSRLIYYIIFKKIKEVRLLEYFDYNKRSVDKVLEEELGWEDYGGHHHENNFTKFFQSYYLPQKFNIDKRKTELSALIRSGQISREKALNEIESHPYFYEKELIQYVIKKLGLSEKEFEEIYNLPVRTHNDYPTYLRLIRLLKFPIKIAGKLRLVPQILYLKYAK
jgi:N-acetyl sugar amidotransferase